VRGFAASGGGSRGQWHIGVLNHHLTDLNRTYDAYAGVSVGAIVSAWMAQYPKDKQGDGIEALGELFGPVRDQDVWRRWFPFGKLHGLGPKWLPGFHEKSFLNSSPLHRLVQRHLRVEDIHKSGVKLRLGAVSLDTGEYRTFDEKHPGLLEAVLASASYPMFLSPVKIEKQRYTDGGVRVVTPIKALIEAGCDEIDVSICHPRGLPADFPNASNALDVGFRALDAMMDELTWKDVKLAQLYNGQPDRKVVTLRVISPSMLLNHDSLRFDPREANEIQLRGYRTAAEVSGFEKGVQA
jgi:predicted acylesterase/phospholipase RssA